MRKRKIFLILFPLFLGVAIYFLYRSKNLFYFNIFKTHPLLYQLVLDIRTIAWLYRKHLPLWTVYSFPDGLWLFSFGAILLIDRLHYYLHFFIFTIIYILMVMLEFLQKYFGGHGTIIGTFDKLDILFFTIAYFSISLISFFMKLKEDNPLTDTSKKSEILEDIKFIFIFIILGVLPSLF